MSCCEVMDKLIEAEDRILGLKDEIRLLEYQLEQAHDDLARTLMSRAGRGESDVENVNSDSR